MKATYNGVGQMVAEKWYNSSDELTAHYKYVYDGQGNIVRSIDIFGGKAYNYLYEDGKIMQSSESDIELDSNEIITSKTFGCTVRYYYDAEDNLIRKRIKFADGKEHTVLYEQAENDSQVVRFTAGDKTVTSHSKTDSFGRKVFDELQLGAGFLSRQFHYLEGEFTDEHKNNDMLKSTPTTQLISQIVLSGNRTISYEYDEEERITKVTDSVDGITEYTYDALGQLLTEKKDGETVNEMTYDNYGNIKTKNGVEYTYGDENWKDLLTGVGAQSISYDAQGNPISYLGHTLTWEKGRQLKSFDDIQYTYNANGIRTSKTVDGIRHDYILDGAKIVRETWKIGDVVNAIVPLYDNEDSVCGIIYNEVPYYFLKNQQGDIIAITDNTGKDVARYSYDAWGVCTVTQDNSGCDIANINPFRYRGYYFDKEIGMYYLQSRYYDPTVGRFVNSDEAEFINICRVANGTSLFSYCANACVNDSDELGFFPVHIVAGVIMGILWSVLPRIISDIIRRRMSRISDYICDAIIGALYGLITSLTGNSTVASIFSTFVGEMARFLIQNGPKLKTMNCKDIILAFLSVILKTLIAGFSDKLAGKIVSKLRRKKFSSAQTRNYFKNTKYLKSAFGIGKGGKTGSRVWFKETGLSTVFSNFLNKMFGL